MIRKGQKLVSQTTVSKTFTYFFHMSRIYRERKVYKRSEYTIWQPPKEQIVDMEHEEIPTKEAAKQGLRVLQENFPKLKKEIMDTLKCDKDYLGKHLDFEYIADFNGKQSMKNWVTSSDTDSKEGASKCSLTLSSDSKALFYGYLNTKLPDNFVGKRTGYVNLRSPYKMTPFGKVTPYDWSRYTHLYLRVRGDGRNYMLNIPMKRYYDVMWYDSFHYPLYTRGGPYWQIYKVPFSKFYFANSGRIQDNQDTLDHFNLTQVSCFSITLADKVPGPFQLEIDYIALLRDHNSTTVSEYETYQCDIGDTYT